MLLLLVGIVLAVEGEVLANTPYEPSPPTASTESCPDPNAIRKKCAFAETCQPTCAVPNVRTCPRICVKDGCECKPGYVLAASGGKCIQIEECPLTNTTCNGDPNAIIRSNPKPCLPTCASPNGAPECPRQGLTVGCVCKPDYIKSEDSGQCILLTECPGGNP